MGVLLAYLLGVLTVIKNQPCPKPDEARGQQNQGIPQPNPIVITYTPPPLADEEMAEKKERERREKTKFKIERWGLFVLVLYTTFTGYIALETKEATIAAKKSADAAKSAADTSAKQLEMSERPWITAKITFIGPPSRFNESSGMTVNKDGSATFNIFVVSKNIGRTIATDVYADVATSLSILSKEEFAKRLNEHNSKCDRIRNIPFREDPPRWPGLFPGEEGNQRMTLSISKADIDAFNNRHRKSSTVRTISILLYGCVSYGSSISSAVHQTKFTYVVMPVVLAKGSVSPSKLEVVEYPLSSKDAD